LEYTRDSKIGEWQGSAQILNQAAETQKCPGDFFVAEQVSESELARREPATKQLNLKNLAMQADLKICGCSTQSEPIFESRAVYTEKNSSLVKEA